MHHHTSHQTNQQPSRLQRSNSLRQSRSPCRHTTQRYQDTKRASKTAQNVTSTIQRKYQLYTTHSLTSHNQPMSTRLQGSQKQHPNSKTAITTQFPQTEENNTGLQAGIQARTIPTRTQNCNQTNTGTHSQPLSLRRHQGSAVFPQHHKPYPPHTIRNQQPPTYPIRNL